MKKTSVKDIGASVRARLLRLARERGEDLAEPVAELGQIARFEARASSPFDACIEPLKREPSKPSEAGHVHLSFAASPCLAISAAKLAHDVRASHEAYSREHAGLG